jgi:hypothetical protein
MIWLDDLDDSLLELHEKPRISGRSQGLMYRDCLLLYRLNLSLDSTTRHGRKLECIFFRWLMKLPIGRWHELSLFQSSFKMFFHDIIVLAKYCASIVKCLASSTYIVIHGEWFTWTCTLSFKMRISTKIYLSQNVLHDQLVNEQTLKMFYLKRSGISWWNSQACCCPLESN